ncbi:unnamed protein product [Pleuronectes platessa]|uniref:Uncharacterized protein n=1 Tax=Pleuronectes platessa TaxID=8262 RepID=A0A9N7ZA85_PLEPL|nr:unnamed protein product [Pleuronectes platessa]
MGREALKGEISEGERKGSMRNGVLGETNGREVEFGVSIDDLHELSSNTALMNLRSVGHGRVRGHSEDSSLTFGTLSH